MEDNQPGFLKGNSGLFVSACLKTPQLLEEKMTTIAAHPENRGKFYLQTILSCFIILALCCFYLLVYGPEKGFAATTYYVDSIFGNDSYSGRSMVWNGTDGPWRTLANINDPYAAFTGGDQILLRRGQKWNNRVTINNVKAALAIRCSGSYINQAISYITIADYTDDPNLPKPIINGNGLDCAIYLDQDFIKIKNLDLAINKNFLTPILSLLLLYSSNEDSSENTLSSTSSSLTLPAISLPAPPPPAPAKSRPKISLPFLLVSSLPHLHLDPPVLPPVLPAAPPSPEIPAGFFLTPAGELIPIPATPYSITSSPIPPVPLEAETAAATRVKGKGIRIQPSGNNYTVENNIVIESCDVHDFPASGISIGSNRGYITIKGEIVGDSSSSNIYNNRQNGIEVFIAPEQVGDVVNIKNKIDGCFIYNNTWNGISLRGDQATIANNQIYSNGNELDSFSNPTHNIYLYGDHGNVYGNYIALSGSGGKGCGFRYSGSNLKFGIDHNGDPGRNYVEDNYNAGIGLWSNDPTHNCDNNIIANNKFHVVKTGIGGNNMAISIGYDLNMAIFTNTYIYDNIITGDNDPEKKTGGIDIQPCQSLHIYGNTFSGNLVSERIAGPLIQIDRYGWDSRGNYWEWNIPDLNNNFSENNKFYVNLQKNPDDTMNTNQLWFADHLYNNQYNYMTWDEWISIGRDTGSQLLQGLY